MNIRIHIVAALLSIASISSACEAGGSVEELAPRSLEGTDIDGHFTIEAGRFVFDSEARRAFDYFLTTSGELEFEALDAWVAEQVRAELGPHEHVHAEVMAAWRRYLSFRGEAAVLLSPGQDGDALELEALERGLLTALDTHLGDAPIAAEERVHIKQGLAVHRAYLLDDLDLREAKLAALSELEAQRFATSNAGLYLAGRQAIVEAQAAGAEPETIAALRSEHFEAIAPGASERLVALDARRAEWDARLSAFAAARATLEPVVSPEQLAVQLAELSEASFTPAERRRLTALGEL